MLRPVLAALLALGLLAAPLVVPAQPPAVPRVGLIGDGPATASYLEGFRQGLHDLGYVEGKNILVESRFADGVLDRMPTLVSELLERRVDVLVVGGSAAARAARDRTTTVPIVFTLVGDPLALGLVRSLARPGGNVTGISNVGPELWGKQLELLKAAVPRAARVGVLYDPLTHTGPDPLDGLRRAGRALKVELQLLGVRQPDELTSAFSALAAARAGAVCVLSAPVFGRQLGRIAELSVQHRLPSIYNRKEFVEDGGLLAYGPSFTDNYRRAAGYVDRILKGARPADLPVERPTTFELAVNLRTARALGLTISPSLLGRADRIVE